MVFSELGNLEIASLYIELFREYSWQIWVTGIFLQAPEYKNNLAKAVFIKRDIFCSSI
jgi:hypothetical protein